ncbi:alcohol dehydrogenase [Sulfolobales archaeon HS-7]|nr:alcohol dehydrogenase [Sulfolobales archaeon HS-7]
MSVYKGSSFGKPTHIYNKYRKIIPVKAVVITQEGTRLLDTEVPKIGNNELLIQMKACGLCGTDLEKMSGEYTASLPILGHEPAGVVAESKTELFEPGDRVFVHHHVPDYTCYYCAHGSPTMCPQYRRTNIFPGGFSEYFRVPKENLLGVLKLPSNLSFEKGTLIEPLATVIRAQRRLGMVKGDTIFISGAGPMGDLHLLLAKQYGTVIISDVSEYRLSFAERLGGITINAKDVDTEVRSLTDGRGADVAIIASGVPAAIESAIKSVRRGGKVLLFGVPYKQAVVSPEYLLNNEISLISSNAAVEEDTKSALDLLVEGKIQFEKIITHEFSLDEFFLAVDEAKKGNVIKAIIKSS